MPQLPALDDFPYVPQEEDSLACVPACVEMVCQFLGVGKSRDEIELELDYSVDSCTPFENVGLLSGVLGIRVCSIKEAVRELERGLPTIVNVRVNGPGLLGYGGDRPFLHAVVLVGMQSEVGLLFDPLSLVQLSTTAPIRFEASALERAWISGWALTARI